MALLETRRIRPDLFVFNMNVDGQVQAFIAVDDTYVAIEPQFRLALLHGLCGHALERDQEDVQDIRATTFLGYSTLALLDGLGWHWRRVWTCKRAATRTGDDGNNEEVDRYWAKLIGQATVTADPVRPTRCCRCSCSTRWRSSSTVVLLAENILFTVIPDTLDYKLYPVSGRILRLDCGARPEQRPAERR